MPKQTENNRRNTCKQVDHLSDGSDELLRTELIECNCCKKSNSDTEDNVTITVIPSWLCKRIIKFSGPVYIDGEV